MRLKVVYKGNGKDVLWSLSTLRFTTSENPFRIASFLRPHQAASSGDHLEAAKKAGYKDTHTLRNQACKLRRECADEITEELHRNFAEIAPRALNILSDLAENAESESVRLGATRDLLDRAGFRTVDRHEIVKEKLIDHD